MPASATLLSFAPDRRASARRMLSSHRRQPVRGPRRAGRATLPITAAGTTNAVRRRLPAEHLHVPSRCRPMRRGGAVHRDFGHLPGGRLRAGRDLLRGELEQRRLRQRRCRSLFGDAPRRASTPSRRRPSRAAPMPANAMWLSFAPDRRAPARRMRSSHRRRPARGPRRAGRATRPITAAGRPTPASTSSGRAPSRAAPMPASATWRSSAPDRRARARRTRSSRPRRLHGELERRRLRQRRGRSLSAGPPTPASTSSRRRPSRAAPRRVQCDVAETCTGTSGAVRRTPFATSADDAARAASQGGACDNDAADHCSGTANACVDAFQRQHLHVPRLDAGQCDVAETCTGSSGTCPADVFASSATTLHGQLAGRRVRQRRGRSLQRVEQHLRRRLPSRAPSRAAARRVSATWRRPARDRRASARRTCSRSSATLCAGSRRTAARATTTRPITATGRATRASTSTGRRASRAAARRASATWRRPAPDRRAPARRMRSRSSDDELHGRPRTAARATTTRPITAAGRATPASTSIQASSVHVPRLARANATWRRPAPDRRAPARRTRSSPRRRSARQLATAARATTTRPITAPGRATPASTSIRAATFTCRADRRRSATWRKPAPGRRARARRTGSQPSATICTGVTNGGACDDDPADHCSGSANTCVDVVSRPSTFTCRGSAGSVRRGGDLHRIVGRVPGGRVRARPRRRCTGASNGGACDNDAADHCRGSDNSLRRRLPAGHVHVPRRRRVQCDVAETAPDRRASARRTRSSRRRRSARAARNGGACDNDAADHCSGIEQRPASTSTGPSTFTCRGSTPVQCDVAEPAPGRRAPVRRTPSQPSTTTLHGHLARRRVRQRRGRSLQRDRRTPASTPSSRARSRAAARRGPVRRGGDAAPDRRARARRTRSSRPRRPARGRRTAARATTTRPITAAGRPTRVRRRLPGVDLHVPRRRRPMRRAETCTGTSGVCPADAVEPSTTTCSGASNAGRATTTRPITVPGRPRRASTSSRPSDLHVPRRYGPVRCRGALHRNVGRLPGGRVRAGGDACAGARNTGACDNDAADHCSGTTTSCVDVFQASTFTCRADAGQCDVAETCTGTSGTCPADAVEPSTTTCSGTSTGACDYDAADHCSGTTTACVDVFQASTFTCRADAGQCDVGGALHRIVGRLPGGRGRAGDDACSGAHNSGACDNDAADHCSRDHHARASTSSRRRPSRAERTPASATLAETLHRIVGHLPGGRLRAGDDALRGSFEQRRLRQRRGRSLFRDHHGLRRCLPGVDLHVPRRHRPVRRWRDSAPDRRAPARRTGSSRRRRPLRGSLDRRGVR